MTDAEERDEQILTGTLPPTPEEQLARDWEVEDALAEKAEAMGITGPWTRFSPAECAVLAAALDAALAAGEMVGVSNEWTPLGEALRRKALAGAMR